MAFFSVQRSLPCNKGRILIVDDEQTILNLFQIVLSSELPDVRIDLANNGAEALRAFHLGHHSVLLMDLRMPVMDGRAAFLQIQKDCKQKNWEMPAVIFCTGFAPPDYILNVVSGNATHGLLPKPVSNETLVEAVKSRLIP